MAIAIGDWFRGMFPRLYQMVFLQRGHLSLFWKSNTYFRSVLIDTNLKELVCLESLLKERGFHGVERGAKPSDVFIVEQM